jgi:hypothetical protein
MRVGVWAAKARRGRRTKSDLEKTPKKRQLEANETGYSVCWL